MTAVLQTAVGAAKEWWRVETRQPLLFVLKLLGLFIGFTGAILLLGYVHFEWSYERWNPLSDRLARAVETRSVEDGTRSVQLPYPFAQAARDELPGVEDFARVQPLRAMMQHGTDKFNETLFFVDPSFVRLFDVRFVASSAYALGAPGTAVLSETAARKYFGGANAVGQTLLLGGERLVTVGAVMRDWPANSHLHPDFLLPLDGFFQMIQDQAKVPRSAVTGWDNCHCYVTYLLLARPDQIASASAVLPALLTRAQGGRYARETPVSLQPVRDAYLRSGPYTTYIDHARKGDPTQLVVLAGIALILLLIAAINFANFSMAQSTLRSREIAVRRVLGASRTAVVVRLLVEALLLGAVVLAASYLAALLLAGALADYLATPLTAADLLRPGAVAQMVAVAALTSIAGGSFAAVKLAATRPAMLLRDGVGSSTGGLSVSQVRQAMVFAQFVISCGLIIVALGISSQMRFIRNAPRGYVAHDKVVVNAEGSHTAFGQIKARIAALPQVASVSIANAVPTTPVSNLRRIVPVGTQPDRYREIALNEADFDHLSSLGAHVVAGRELGRQYGGDRFVLPDAPRAGLSFNAVMNASAAQALGYSSPQAAVGGVLAFADDPSIAYTMRIVGVVGDVRYGGPHNAVAPMIYLARDDWEVNYHETRQFLVTTRRANDASVVAPIVGLWNALVPGFVATVKPLPAALEEGLAGDTRQAQLVSVFATTAVLISLLGVMGLAAFAMERRAKEMAVRRVLGASRASIARLVTRSQLLAVVLAPLVSCPLAWLAISRWLVRFELRTAIAPWWFVAGVASTTLLTVAVVFVFTYHIISRSPARFLKAE